MFEKLKGFVEKFTESRTFDPSVFNDPIAMQTSWTPLKRGGANFKTHSLKEIDQHKLLFVPSTGAKLFCGLFVAMGSAFIFLELFVGVSDPDTDPFWGRVMVILFSLLFVGVGAGLYYFKAVPRKFDKWAGLYWKGYKKPVNMYDRSSGAEFARLGEIHAIQIVEEHISSNNGSYRSYELNLVLNNGDRLNVIDHGSMKAVKNDAQTLSRFLNKPVWDSTEPN
jgi:hypothetical protein